MDSEDSLSSLIPDSLPIEGGAGSQSTDSQLSKRFEVAVALFLGAADTSNSSLPTTELSTDTSSRSSMDDSAQLSVLKYSQLQIVEPSLPLLSGDIHDLPVFIFDESSNARVSAISPKLGSTLLSNDIKLDCSIVGDDLLNVKILPNCQLMAIKPGLLRIQARLYDLSSQTILMSNIIDVAVVSKPLTLAAGGFNVRMEAWQPSVWFSLSGLMGQQFYLATLKSSHALLPTGVSIELIPSSSTMVGMCSNNVPSNANRVACYFEAQENEAVIIIHNNAHQPFDAVLNISPDNLNRQLSAVYTVAYKKNEAKPIYLDSPITAYVFANELGTNNTHFYRFNAEIKNAEKVKFTVSNYTHLVALNVSWGNNVCTNSMRTISVNRTACVIEEYVGGDVIIGIDGNNGVDLVNAPAAVDGGTTYSLIVEKVR